MTSLSLKDEVQKALNVEWQGFASRHPRLAQFIDQNLLMEQAVASIGEDPAFRAALDEAAGLATAASAVEEAVKKFVGDWIGKLF